MDMETAAKGLKVGHIRGIERELGCSLSDLAPSNKNGEEPDADGDQLAFAAFIVHSARDPSADFDTLWQRVDDMSLGEIEEAVDDFDGASVDPPQPAVGGSSS